MEFRWKHDTMGFELELLGNRTLPSDPVVAVWRQSRIRVANHWHEDTTRGASVAADDGKATSFKRRSGNRPHERRRREADHDLSSSDFMPPPPPAICPDRHHRALHPQIFHP